MTDDMLDSLKQRKMEELMKQNALEERIATLVNLIKQTVEFRNHWAIRKQIESDPATWGLIKSFEIQKKKLAAPMARPAEVQRLQVLAQQISRNMEAIAYYQSLKALGKLFRSIHLRITDKIGFRFAVRGR
ncbi:MAG: YlbF family regulator [Candidatus Thorarchaeota archaeon]